MRAEERKEMGEIRRDRGGGGGVDRGFERER